MKVRVENIKFENYSAEDFALEESFISWVKISNKSGENFWDMWIAENPQKKGEVEKARFIISGLNETSRVIPESELDLAWNSLWQKQSLLNKESKLKRFQPNSQQFFRVVAIIVVTLAAVLLVNNLYFTSDEMAIKWTEKSTTSGQKLLVYLPDGSKVKLNSESSIRYDSDFNGSERNIILEGEAFFDVVHISNKPFTVSSSNLTTTVYGTTFNIKSYPSEPLEVSLESGSIKVSRTSKSEIFEEYLNPGERMIIPQSTIGVNGEVNLFDPKSAFGWKDGYLNFDKTPFDKVVQDLERWYGVEILVESEENNLTGWKFQGSFHNKSLAYILETLAYPNLFDFNISGNKVIITYN